MEISVFVFDVLLPIGARCRLIRVARNLRQYDVAFAAGVSPSDVSMLERGLPVASAVRRRILMVLDLDEASTHV